jgi:hypothetical protein
VECFHEVEEYSVEAEQVGFLGDEHETKINEIQTMDVKV